MSSNNKNIPVKEKFQWIRTTKSSQSLKVKSILKNNAGSGKNKLTRSTSDLASHVFTNTFSMCTEGTVKVQRYDDIALTVLEKLRFASKKNSWEIHYLILGKYEIFSKTNTGVFKQPIPYSSIKQAVCVDYPRESHFCIKVVCCNITFLLEVANCHQRDMWFHSLQWKVNVDAYRNFLYNATTAESLIAELKVMVKLALNSSLYPDSTNSSILEIVSELLVTKSDLMSKSADEILIKTLAPLVEKNQPSYELCTFFTKHCRNAPRSLVVIEIFLPIVQRILKHNVDFSKCVHLRMFVIDYIQALNSQNEGMEKVKKFIHDMHGPMCQCPHIRILNNFVAICLSGIYQSYVKPSDNKEKADKELKKPKKNRLQNGDHNHVKVLNNAREVKNKNMKNAAQEAKLKNIEIKPSNCDQANLNLKENYSHDTQKMKVNDDISPHDDDQERKKMLNLFVQVINEIASFSDWTPGLASFLQPLPFPEEALKSKEFIRLMQSVVERFAEDERESVVKCLLPIREGRGSWLEGYSPNSKLCSDEGQLFSKMVQSLMDPNIQSGKIRKFLVLLSESHLQAVMMLAVRENLTMIKALKDMLLLSIISDEQVQLQVISALRCTKSGSEAYSEANAILMAPVNKEGPMKFQLASNSNDCDLQTLLSTGSWGNLRTLDLSFTSVTSSCVGVIKNLPNITSINLWSTQFDDAGLLMLCDSLDLTELNLCETFVTDEGIKCLEVMKNLKKLNLNSTAVSEKAFFYLKQSLPNCSFDVTYTDAWFP